VNTQPPERADIPDDSLINCEIVITSYFDEDGKLKYATNIGGDPNLAQALGLCEMAKQAIYAIYMHNESYPPDDDEEDN
jgi:hypothetical protein